MYQLTVSGNFAAAHSIPTFPEGHKCRNLHGHTWEIEVSYEFSKRNKNGICVDFGMLKDSLRDHIISILDHSNLDDRFEIASAENIAEWIFETILNIPYPVIEKFNQKISSVKVKESSNAWVVYDGK